jgi:hypothetical protein
MYKHPQKFGLSSGAKGDKGDFSIFFKKFSKFTLVSQPYFFALIGTGCTRMDGTSNPFRVVARNQVGKGDDSFFSFGAGCTTFFRFGALFLILFFQEKNSAHQALQN